ncbi:hypothetical protein [Dactylosporangium sp. CA-092794]|uniref:hypothetical protein n=1 Tax=Dactylosporangium sp. CA-092794 TaxID=3239929 RepID=UPI003D89FE92
MAETGARVLRAWLLIALRELGDAAPRQAVHQAVATLFGDQFTDDDLAPRRGRAGAEQAWRNNLDSLYDRLKKERILLPSQRAQPWRLSPAGSTEASGLPEVGVGTLKPDGQFNPKGSGPYTANIAAAVQVKMREHEALLADYGRAVAAIGWRPVTTVHPRDLELSRAGKTWLAEVKMVYGARVTPAVREALAQLLAYRYFFYPAVPHPGLLAVFSEDPGGDNVGLLLSIGIASVWRSESGWEGCQAAIAAGLVPTAANMASP